MKTKQIIILGLFALNAVPFTVNGAILAYQGFDGAESGWNSFNVPSNYSTTATGLTYDTLTVAGNALTATSDGQWTDSTLPSVQNSGIVYASYLVNAGTKLDSNDSAFLWFYQGGNEKFRAGYVPWSNPNYGIGLFNAATNEQSWSAQTAVDNTTFLVVTKLDFTNTTVSMFINPAVDGNEPGSPNVSQNVNSVTNMSFDTVRIFIENAATSGTRIDEIRIGTTWTDVVPVPEPASMALMAAGCMLLIVWARRRCIG